MATETRRPLLPCISSFWLLAAGTDPASQWYQRPSYHQGIDRATFVDRNIVFSAAVLVLSETVLVIECPRKSSHHNLSSGN